MGKTSFSLVLPILLHASVYGQGLEYWQSIETPGSVPGIFISGLNTRILRQIIEAYQELPATVWKRLVEVRTESGRLIGLYLVFNLHGSYFSYNPSRGSQRIWPNARSADSLARATNPGVTVTGSFVDAPRTLAAE
jgi:hypothetical protein